MKLLKITYFFIFLFLLLTNTSFGQYEDSKAPSRQTTVEEPMPAPVDAKAGTIEDAEIHTDPTNKKVRTDAYELRKFDRAKIEEYRKEASFHDMERLRQLEGMDKIELSPEQLEELQKQRERAIQENRSVQEMQRQLDSIRRIEYQKNQEKAAERKRDVERQRSSPPKRETPPKGNPNAINFNWIWILLIAVVLFLVIAYFMGLKPNAFKKKQTEETVTNIEEQHINDIKFETELEKAIRLGNYKTAIRILYLESLKHLNDNQMILWHKNKTNWDYWSEVQRPELKKEFQTLTLAFEYVWYGNFKVEQHAFTTLQKEFHQFNDQINRA